MDERFGAGRRTRAATLAVALIAFVAAPSLSADAPAPGRIAGDLDAAEPGVLVAGRTVSLLTDGAPPRTALSDDVGRFEFDGVVPGVAYEVRMATEGLPTVRVPGIVIVPGERRDVGSLTAGAAQSVVVHVVDEAGRPLKDATVDAFREPSGPLEEFVERARCDDPPPPAETATTDARGVATLALAPGAWWTVAAHAPGRARAARPRLERGHSKPMEFALVLPRAETLTGRVVDADGRAVPRAFVVARKFIPMIGNCATCEPQQYSSALWQHAVADADGRFELGGLVPGETEIVAGRPGTAGEYVLRADVPSVRDVELELGGTATVAGRAFDEASGAPVAGVVVAARSGYSARLCVTDAAGRYEIAGLAADGELSMNADLAPGWTRPRGALLPWDDVSLRAGQTFRADCPLKRGAVVTGHVLRDGVPLADAAVTVVTLPTELDGWVPGFAEGRADRSGRFRVDDVLPGRVVIFAAGPEDDSSAAYDVFYKQVVRTADGRAKFAFDAAPGAVVAHDAVACPPLPRTAEETEASEKVPDAIRDVPRVVVHGRVTSADDVAPLNVRWSVEPGEADPNDGMRIAVPLAADGTFERDTFLFDESRKVTVYAVDDRHDLTTVTVEVPDGANEITVDVKLRGRPALRGHVTSLGEPVAGALVRVNGIVVASTAADGAFAIRARSGKVDLSVAARGFVPKRVGELDVPPPGDVDVALEPALVLAGRVADAKDAPVAGVLVTPRSDGFDVPTPSGVVTDADGRFRVDGLAAGEWRLRVESAPGASSLVVTTTTAPLAAGTKDAHIVVLSGRRIAGRVTDSAGRALDRLEVVCRPGPGGDEKADARTDANGRFAFEGLAEGTFAIDVRPALSAGLVYAKVETKSGATDLVVTLAAAPTITGVLVDEKGAPIAKEYLQASCIDEGTDDPYPSWDRPEATTGDDGSFRLVVPAGKRFCVKPGRISHLPDGTTLRGGEDVTAGAKDVRVVAVRGSGIFGIVVDLEGKPLAGATVAIGLHGVEDSVVTGADGRFRFDAPEDVAIPLRARLEGRAPVMRFGVHATTAELRVEMKPGLAISGRLLDADGRPRAGYVLRALSPSLPGLDLWRAPPDAEGRFELKDLAAGDWYLEAIPAGAKSGAESVSLGQQKAGAKDVELRLPR
jgi:hypothetical protein